MRRCDHCGMTEDHHYDELGMGPLIPLEISIDPGEELQNYTGEAGSHREALMCNDAFIEFVDSQPRWLQEMFARNNPALYRLHL